MLKIASKCYNQAHKHWHSRMEASFFIRGGGRRSAAPSPGPASAWLPSTGACGGVGASLARAPLSPDPGAASSCSAGGGSIACVVLANLRSSADAPFSRLIRTLPLCALQVHEVLAGKFSISPYCRQNQRNLHLLWLHHHLVGERRCFRSQRPETTCCCQFTAMTASTKYQLGLIITL